MSTSPFSYPPGWKKPSEVIRSVRMARKRKKALEARLNLDTNRSSSQKIVAPRKSTNERFNPFRLEDKKCSNKNEIDRKIPAVLEESNDSTLFQLLNSSSQSLRSNLAQSEQSKPNILTLLREKTKPEKPIQYNWEVSPKVDWALKTKLRILSTRPFLWSSSTLKTSEEASGTTGFVRCLHSNELSGHQALDSSPSANLHRRCLYWIHPSLPWLQLFPRFATGLSVVNTFYNSDPKIRQQLYIDWCDSFRSLFLLLRARQCPYFYVCAYNFTVIFRAAGLAGLSEAHAMIAPTTKGIRDALVEEGITFTQPLVKNKRHSSTDSGIGTDSESSQEPSKIISEGSSILHQNEDDDADVSSWMNSVGLEESILTGTSLQRKMTQRELAASDSRAESLVYIDGEEVHAFYNFLLNSNNISIAPTGALAGVPPSLIAPVAFQGATLRSLKVAHSIVQKGQQKMHSTELQGPILPHLSHSLIQLMHTYDPNVSFTMSMSTLDSTAPFSTSLASSFVPLAFASQSLTDCGLQPQILDTLCSSVDTSVVREIVCEEGKFRSS